MKEIRRFTQFVAAAVLMAGATSWAAPMPLSSATKKQKLGAQLPEGEKAIYLRVVDAYRQGNLEQTAKFKGLLLKHYPQSIHADNALYLTGLLYYQRGKIAEAVKEFGDLIQRYPNGNKRVAAMYAKSVAYNKLNLKEFSRRLLQEILKKYPGSPESQRAWMDMRIREGRG